MGDNDGLICTECGEWFAFIYNNSPMNNLRFFFCPLCGHEYTDEEIEEMCKEEGVEEKEDKKE